MKINVHSTATVIPRVPDPYDIFSEWYAEAQTSEPEFPNSFTLSTVRPDGFPDGRAVLLKEWDRKGFVFYTNTLSAKGLALAANPRASLCFHWKTTNKQVRALGNIEPVTSAEADDYFATRPRVSQLGAWASAQSEPVPDRRTLLEKLKHFHDRFEGSDVPRPPHWSGYRILPVEIEFWAEGEYRLHDRLLYSRDGEAWTFTTLSP